MSEEFTSFGNEYRVMRMKAKQQWNCARRLAPLLAKSGNLIAAVQQDPSGTGGIDFFAAFQPFAEALSELSDEASDYVIDTCLGHAQRKAANGYRPVVMNGTMMWDDIEMPEMLEITFNVLRENLGNFLQGLPGQTPAKAPASQGLATG